MESGSGKVFGGGPSWSRLTALIGGELDHESIAARVRDDGRLTGRYLILSLLSSAIAALGLMLSSPAVVIGAMLISPLMSPIILLGFSFWMMDWPATRQAIVALVAGLGVALGMALLLTWASPLKEPTTEILSRTHPNLFDLLVAAFSGLAGGYAVIHHRGETVIGVAVATALMPPVATIAFGLGIGDASIAKGAGLLFATNLIAIALAAAAMAAAHGFAPHYHLSNWGWLGHLAVAIVIVALCAPLTLSLEAIAEEGRAASVGRTVIRDVFGDRSRATSLVVRRDGDALRVEALIATPRYVVNAAAVMERRMAALLKHPIQAKVEQVVLADPAKADETATHADLAMAPLQELRAAIPFPTDALAFDPSNHRGLVVLGPASGLDLSGAHALEAGLRARPGLENTEVTPPVQALPPLTVQSDASGDLRSDDDLAVQIWALRRWRASRVEVGVCSGKSARAIEQPLAAALAPLTISLHRLGGAACAHLARGATRITLAPG